MDDAWHFSVLAEHVRAPRGPRCRAQRVDGEQCRGTAVYGGRLCRYHGGEPAPRPKLRPCRCRAYTWPHRAGGGLCRYPDPPQYRLTTPPGTHREPSGWARAQSSLYRRALDHGDPDALAELARRLRLR